MSIHRPSSLLDRALGHVESFFSSLVERQSRASTSSATSTVFLDSPTTPSSSSPTSGPSSEHSTKENELDIVALLVELTLRLAIGVTSGYLLLRMTNHFLKPMLPDSEESNTPPSTVYRRLQRILLKRGIAEPLPQLNSYERQMAEEIVDPDDIESSFADIGGLDNTKQEIYNLAVLPLVQPELFTGKLVQPCKGILLFGKPGTGKTMLAKALAKEAEAVFIPLQLSKILNKWVGESNKLIAATFSLAHKLQPAIIFIDELDTFLKASNSETAYLDSIKAEFLTLWDGIATASVSRVLVLGATNKPASIDSAILRRMPRAFKVPLPDREGRRAILTLLFKGEKLDDEARAFLPSLADLSVGYSGSDLKEVCKAAAMVAVQERTAEFARKKVMGETIQPDDSVAKTPIRHMSKNDLLIGLDKVKRTGAVAQAYGKEDAAEQLREESTPIDAKSLRALTALIRSLSAVSTDETDLDEVPEIR